MVSVSIPVLSVNFTVVCLWIVLSSLGCSKKKKNSNQNAEKKLPVPLPIPPQDQLATAKISAPPEATKPTPQQKSSHGGSSPKQKEKEVPQSKPDDEKDEKNIPVDYYEDTGGYENCEEIASAKLRKIAMGT